MPMRVIAKKGTVSWSNLSRKTQSAALIQPPAHAACARRECHRGDSTSRPCGARRDDVCRLERAADGRSIQFNTALPGSPTSTATQLGAHLDMSRQHVTRMAEQGVIIRRSSARKRKSFGA